jgi:excisionase family DNA binding protein
VSDADKAIAQSTGVRQLAVTVDEAAQLARLSRAYIYQAISSKKLASRKHGRRRLIMLTDLEAYLRGQT